MTARSTARARSAPTLPPQLRDAIESASRHYARLAAELLGAPLTAVQVERAGRPVVYERGSFDAGEGYDGARQLCSTVGSHLWFARAPVVVPDVEQARSIFNGKGPPRGIGAYLATPLVGRAGHFLGTICAADYAPRDWTAEETDRLRTLAASLSDDLEQSDPVAALAPRLATERMEALRETMQELQRVSAELEATRRLLEAERERSRALEEHPVAVGEEASAPAPGDDFEELLASAALTAGVPVVEQLRRLIAGALDSGSLRVGQRLPSIRAIADRFGVTSYAALQAYASLEAEGVVERRERSGVYVAAADWPAPSRLPETAEWLAGVLTQACEHQLRIPQLPDLLRRWTGTVPIRCACVESCADTVAALCHDLSSRFGMHAVPVDPAEILTAVGGPRRTSVLPPAVQEANLLVTTPFHASRIRAIAEATGKPLLVATMNPEIVEAVESHLAERDLTVVCVDRAAGERIRDLRGGAYRSRVRVVLADEVEAAGLDRSEPVLLTQAARQRLKGASLRLVAPPSPAFSLDFARKVSGTLLRLNIDGGRG